MANNEGNLLDEDGTVYEKNRSGEYSPKTGLFGEEKQGGLFGPNLERGLMGQPIQAKDERGDPITNSHGRPLYRPSGLDTSSSSNENNNTNTTDGLAVIAAMIMLLAIIVAIPIVIKLAKKLWELISKGYEAAKEKRWDDAIKYWSIPGVLILCGCCLAGSLLIQNIPAFAYSVQPKPTSTRIIPTLVYLQPAAMEPTPIETAYNSFDPLPDPTDIPTIHPTSTSPANFEPTVSASNKTYAIISGEVIDVFLRKTPGYRNKKKSDIITKIPSGAKVEILEGPVTEDGLNWWRVSWNGYEGWVADHTGKGREILEF